MSKNNLSELLGISENRDIIIEDNILERGKQNKQERKGSKLESYEKDAFVGGLRSLPLLYRLGLKDFTFNSKWIKRQDLKDNDGRSIPAYYMWADQSKDSQKYDFELIPPFKYHKIKKPSEIQEVSSKTKTLVMATNQNTENCQKSISMRDFIDSNIERKVALVPENFHFKGEIHGRNLSDYGDFYSVTYEDLLNRYMETKDFELSNFHSKNIIIREIEEEFFKSKKYAAEDIPTLFDITKIPEGFSTRKYIRNVSRPFTVERHKLIKTLFYPWIDCDSFSSFTKTFLTSVYIFRLESWYLR